MVVEENKSKSARDRDTQREKRRDNDSVDQLLDLISTTKEPDNHGHMLRSGSHFCSLPLTVPARHLLFISRHYPRMSLCVSLMVFQLDHES